MPLNLLVRYNALLDVTAMSGQERNASLKGIFNRDIVNNSSFAFRTKKINPTPAEGEDEMERLFKHLTTTMTDKNTRKREFDLARSTRLHWIRYHIEEQKKERVLVFSVSEPEGNRTYIYDVDEKYVIVLEPLRDSSKKGYALLTAYHEEGKDRERGKIMKKYKRKLLEVL
ncbi:hypothetical protein FACS1894181_05110 [Bacteroidia bacterium]|nr:hypothetical protein FACS189435_2360 [Bacteroidia bacterium]GHV48678.1 hypothetical protein FACS1894181_05110 [Bacteroidia bacterium]